MFASIGPVLGRRMAAITVGSMLMLLTACGGGMGYGAGSSTGTAASTPPAGTGSSSSSSGVTDAAGSGTGTSPVSCTASSCGSALITLTDAKGDFLSYIVSLTSLQLQTASGATVETIPATTKVDFAQLVDLTEVLGAGQIPAAEYVGAKLTIDYRNAQIAADDGTGNPIALKPIDSSGAAITGPLTVTVRLDSARHLQITPGQIGQLALDFNLGVSNIVDLTAGTVTVAPTLVATNALTDAKQTRVRGALGTVSTDENDFIVDVLPFHDENSTTGEMTVHVGAGTSYQLDGKAFSGDAGIAALASVPPGTKVAAFGTFQDGPQATFTATRVLAGSSLESSRQSGISGTVIARSHTTLTVRAATWSGSDGDFDFERQDSTVMVGPDTVVMEEGRTGSFSAADISVGQRIEASGTASRGSDGSVSLDATAGQVRLDVTVASGIVTRLADGSLTFNLSSLDGLPASVFDFSGTGSSAANDADPTAYLVDTGTLTQSNVLLNSPAQALGFVTGFGLAPPDFVAETLVTAPAVEAELQIRFGRSGSQTAFIGLSPVSTSLVLNLSSLTTTDGGDSNGGGDRGGEGTVGPTAHDQGGSGGSGGGGSDGSGDNGDGNDPFLEIGAQRIDVRHLAALSIVPDSTRRDAVFTIGQAGSMLNENFSTFPDFVARLATDLASGTAAVAVTASGHFDAASGTFTASHLAVLLAD